MATRSRPAEAGADSIFESCPLERVARDAHAASHHIAMTPNNYVLLGRIGLGLDPKRRESETGALEGATRPTGRRRKENPARPFERAGSIIQTLLQIPFRNPPLSARGCASCAGRTAPASPPPTPSPAGT